MCKKSEKNSVGIFGFFRLWEPGSKKGERQLIEQLTKIEFDCSLSKIVYKFLF
jgi:hypothetical protein